MKPIKLVCTLLLVYGIVIPVLTLSLDIFAYAQSRESQGLVNRLRSINAHHGRNYKEAGFVAREIGKDSSILPKNRVNALLTVLRHELENPCPRQDLIHGGYVTPTIYLQGRYLAALEDVGTVAIPHLRRHLDRLKLSVQSASRSLGNRQNVNVAEMQYTLLALGSLGKKEVFLDVLALFKAEDSNGILRKKAAVALGKLKNKAAIPDLKRALKDDFHVSYRTCVSDKPQTIYPVREAAFGALRALEVEVVFEGIVDGIRIYRIVR